MLLKALLEDIQTLYSEENSIKMYKQLPAKLLVQISPFLEQKGSKDNIGTLLAPC